MGDMTTTHIIPSHMSQPIEVRIADRKGDINYVLAVAVADNGLLTYSLDNGRGGVAHALSNLQATAIFPRKAVPGWQHEVVAFVESGLYTVAEVR